MPVDPAWPHSGLGLGTGSIPNRAVDNIPAVPFPAGLSPDRRLRLERKYLPISCQSRFPPSSPLPLLPSGGLCPSRFRRIPGDLFPLSRRKQFHLCFGGFSAQRGEVFRQLLVDHSTIITYSAAEHCRVPLPCQSIRSVPSPPRSRHFTSWSSVTLTSTPKRPSQHDFAGV